MITARQALEQAYTLGHTSFESSAYQQGTHDPVKASTRGRITRDSKGGIDIPDFALCHAVETRRGRSGTTNTICKAVEAGKLISAAESNKPALYVLWLRTAYHPMDNSNARKHFKNRLFELWRDNREKRPSGKLAGLMACLLDYAVDNFSYSMRCDGAALYQPAQICRELSGGVYGALWKPCPKKMNWQRDIKPELNAIYDILESLDKNALIPVWDMLSDLSSNKKILRA
jgi:hypothetical protein